MIGYVLLPSPHLCMYSWMLLAILMLLSRHRAVDASKVQLLQFVSPILRSRNLSMGTFSYRNITRRVFAYGIYFRSPKCLQVWNICFHHEMYFK